MVTLRVLGLIALLIGPGGFPISATPVYPANPFLTDHDIFVSVDGVIRLEHESLEPVWFALEGLETDPPVVSRGMVMVGTNAGMFALDVESGMMRWHIPSATKLHSPAVSGEVAYVSGHDGSIRAVGIADGKRRWQRSLEGALFIPALTGKRLVVASEGKKVWGLGREDGRSHWQRALEHAVADRPVADERGRVYACTMGGELLALDSGTGKTQWIQALSAPGSVLVDTKRLYVGQRNGEVSARNRDNGKVMWKKSFAALQIAPLRLLGDTLVVTTATGDNLFLDPGSGDAVRPPREEDPVEPQAMEDDVLVRKD